MIICFSIDNFIEHKQEMTVVMNLPAVILNDTFQAIAKSVIEQN